MNPKKRLLYLAVPAAFVAGISIGAIFAVRRDAAPLFAAAKESLASPTLFSDSLIKALRQNLLTAFLLWIFGTTALGSIPSLLLTGIRGFSVGQAVGALVHAFGFRGFFAAVLGVLPHNLLYAPFLCLLAMFAVRYSIGENRQRTLTKYTLTSFCLTLPVLLGCFVEGYISAPLLRSVLGTYL